MPRQLASSMTSSPNADLSEPLLDARAVAALLGISRDSVYDYAQRKPKPLPGLRFGRHLRFNRSDVESWLTEGHA